MNAVLRQEVELMLRDWKEEVDLKAAGATCPMPNCGALAISYEPSDSISEVVRLASDRWDFVCPECAAEFTSPSSDLLFQAVPRQWLLSDVCHA